MTAELTATLVTPPRGRGFAHVETWIFDLDNTLYHPSACDLFPHMDRRMIEFIADFLQVDEAEANRLRQTYYSSYGATLKGLMELHALAPERFLDYVHEIDLSIMAANPALEAALTALEGRKLIFTNATERHALNVLERLGIAHHFDEIFDVKAAAYVPKPQQEAYATFLRRHDVDPRAAVMFEDMARNLAPAAALGMTTVWVRTDRPHAQPGEADDFIHHIAEDLVDWLQNTCLPQRLQAAAEASSRVAPSADRL